MTSSKTGVDSPAAESGHKSKVPVAYDYRQPSDPVDWALKNNLSLSLL